MSKINEMHSSPLHFSDKPELIVKPRTALEVIVLILSCMLLLGYAFADEAKSRTVSQSSVWVDPSYGPWHSCVMGGGGYLMRTLISPSNPKRMYLHGDMDGMFRSDDGGDSWRIIHGKLGTTEGHYEFAGFAVDPGNANDVAVACGGEWGPQQGVFLSADGGDTWIKTLSVRFMGNGPYSRAGTRLAGSCAKNGLVIAATEGTGVWRSGDGGRTWKKSGLEGIYFTDVYIDKANRNRAWLCAEPVQYQDGSRKISLAGGLYRSDDAGKNWSKLADSSPFEIIQDPIDTDVIYGLSDTTIERSDDFGETWQNASSQLPTITDTPSEPAPSFAIGTGPSFVLVVQTKPAIIYRLDHGQTQWQKIVPTFSETNWRLTFVHPAPDGASSITVSPTNPNHWYLTDSFSFYQSWDAGHSWKPTDAGIETTVIHALTQDPVKPDTVYLGACDVGFWSSDDAGTVFTQTHSDGAGWVGNIKSISASAKSPSRVYAAGGIGWRSDKAYVSNDAVKDVLPIQLQGAGLPSSDFGCDSILVDPQDPNSVYLTTSAVVQPDSGGVYHSSDGGGSWTCMSNGLPQGQPVFLDDIWWGGCELAMSPDNTLLAISSSRNTVYRYDRANGIWTALDLPHTGGLYSVVADPHQRSRFYVCVVGNDADPAVSDGGLFRSDDSGTTWTKIIAGSVHCVTVDAGVKDRVAASTKKGVAVSSDGGNMWITLPQLPNRWLYESMAFGGNRLIVGTGGNGAFWMNLDSVKQVGHKEAKAQSHVK